MALSSGASAQLIIQDDFTQAHDTNSWRTFNGACLTAGDGTGAIPACAGLLYYQGQTLYGGNSGTLPDPAGSGALRFTNGNNNGSTNFANGGNQAGSIISNFTFPTGGGLQVTFKTVTYRGNSGGAGTDGADGMSFFLMDGSLSPYDTGAFGGSLGYTCSNVNNDPTSRTDGSTRGFDGLRGGYLGLGIDEYGNFLNGMTNTLGEGGTTASGDNTASGGGYQPGRIGIRGAGSVSWAGLNALDNLHYPNTLTLAQQQAAVQNTCKTGVIWDYSNPSSPRATATTVPDYVAIPSAYKVLSSVQIAAESAMTRGAAIPITYNLKITQDGLLSLAYSVNGGSYQPVIAKQSITASNGALPSSFRFGFAGSTGGSTNIHEIMCFQATPADLAATSVGINQKEATKISTGTQVFFAYYFPTNWTGDLTASNLLFDPASQTISVANLANWDASCDLTGVVSGQTCASTGVAGPTAAQAQGSRSVLTWNGSAGVPFRFASFSTAMKNAIDAGDATPHNSKRVNYLRGDRTNEINTSGVGLFRARDSVLGDIVDSSPTWVGPPNSPYSIVWHDLLHGAAGMPENTGTQSYSQFVTTAQTRLNVIYAGANDGLLHGFRAGGFDASNNFVNNGTTPNDGQEVLAYMPGTVEQTIHNSSDGTLDYANSQYSHAFYVDATPDEDDLFYGGKWHTWVVGGLGPGGAAIYALDVTDPTTFSEANASSLVVGEWTSSTITCVNVSNCGRSLGSTYGVPVVRRLHNGSWAAIFGNGFASQNGDAGIFIMLVDPTTGLQTFYYLSTGSSANNGIAYVSSADLDGDHVVDYVYAGDLLGNVWRFDLTSTNPSSWTAAATPLFTAPSGQPITSKLLLAIVPQTSGAPRLMVDFGTGRKFPLTNTSSQSYVTGSQSLYGIWDWNMSSWNSQAGGTKQLASLAAPQTIGVNNLTTQTFSTPAPGVRDVTGAVVCWSGSTACPSGNNQFGWKVALPGTNEQVVFNPLLFQNAFIVNTTIPANNSPLSCAAAIDSGFTIAISVSSGGVIPGFFKNYGDTNAAGAQTGGSGTPSTATAGGNAYLMTQTPPGQGCTTCPIPCHGSLCSAQTSLTGQTGKRLTWIQRR
ncbi:MAG TPA: PilC/PilY family type IV pilus protein [Steroidobacteraceae bacterium]